MVCKHGLLSCEECETTIGLLDLITVPEALALPETLQRNEEVGRELCYTTLTRACRLGHLPARKMSKIWAFTLIDYLHWLDNWPHKPGRK